MQEYDVIVVGKGNAALCAALAAGDQGARVVMLEAASVDESGGNKVLDVNMHPIPGLYTAGEFD